MIRRALSAALLLLAGAAVPRCGADDAASLAPGARVKITALEHVHVPGLIEVRGDTVLSTRHFERSDDLWVAADETVTLAVPRAKVTIVGDYQGANTDGIFLRPKGREDIVQVPRAAIARMEVRTHKAHTRTGAALGFLVGAAAGYAVVARGSDFGSLFGVLLPLPGALFGAALGSSTEKWELVEHDRLRLSLSPHAPPGGAGLALILGF